MSRVPTMANIAERTLLDEQIDLKACNVAHSLAQAIQFHKENPGRRVHLKGVVLDKETIGWALGFLLELLTEHEKAQEARHEHP